MTDVRELQLDMEAQTIVDGREKYEKRLIAKVKREGFDKHDEVQKIIRGAIPILAEGIREWVAQAAKAKGRKATSYSALAQLDPNIAAAIGTTAIFGSLAKGGRVTDITVNIGRRIEIELEALAIESKDPKEIDRLMSLAEGKLTPAAVSHRLKALVEQHEAALQWTDSTKVLVGQTVLNVALVTLQELFTTTNVRENGKTPLVVELTDEAALAIVEMENVAALQHLPLKPMIAEPKPWVHIGSGAYYDYRLARLSPLVRMRSKEQRQLVREAINSGQMDVVLTALNAIQDTRWAIDERVLTWVLWAAKEKQRPSKSFPAADKPALPDKIEAALWELMDPAERSARSRKRRSLQVMGKAIAADKATFDADMATARQLSQYAAFFLPHSLDFRGRTYAIPYFNHQRAEHLKALFRFAEGEPLGEHGGKWLMIHLANCGDFGKVSKKPFDDRILWVDENEKLILAAAKDPAGMSWWWTEADSPFCFLQACFEYAEWANTGYSDSYSSTIAGAADGSCSGLQHYSCITRSKDEAYHVNLLPREDVGDIYNVTAGVAGPSLQALAEAQVDQEDKKRLLEQDAAKLILSNGFGRSQVKRNVMTYFYGSARFGMRDQHMQDLMRPLADDVAMGVLEAHPYSMDTERTDKETGEVTIGPDGGYTCAAVMAAHVFSAVTTVAAKADEAAQYIQKVAAALAHEGLSMVWTTPTGFPVVQRYSEYTHTKVAMWLYDRTLRISDMSAKDKLDHAGNVLHRVELTLRQAPTARVDKKTMRNASSPNVIHSMDGAHLHLSVAKARGTGIEYFSMIHDSFGTHLGKMEQFNEIIREALIECYQDYCPLEELDRYARSVLSEEGIEKLPPIPAKGDLDLNEIRKSQYAFA